MLTYYVPTNSDKTNTYWLSTAVHFARNAGADKYDTIEDSSRKHKGILKRLWWCCILRDRVMALGLRRPLHIRPTDFDFTQPRFTESDFQDEIRDSMVYNPATKQLLAQLAVSLCELAIALNDVLALLYPMIGRPKLEDSLQSRKELETSRATLDRWYEKTVAKFYIPTYLHGAHKSLVLFTDMLYIYYQYCYLPRTH